MKDQVNNINNLCKGLSFTFENKTQNINKYEDLIEYIKKINDKAESIDYISNNNYENNLNKFISLFGESFNFFYETISGNIKYTKELKINLKSKQGNNFELINNVFILNHDKDKFCFEIKLGNGIWDKLPYNKDEFNIFNNDKRINNTFKIGLIKINQKDLKDFKNDLYTKNQRNILEMFYNKESTYEIKFLEQSAEEKLIKKYKKFKNSIYYSFDLDNIIKKPFGVNNEDISSAISTIHKNDIIGVAIDKNYMKGYIQFNIYINGILNNTELIPNIHENNIYPYFDIEDEYNEIKELNDKDSLISFIELGPNNSIFIKDKPNNKKIESNEKMSFYDSYKYPSLNDFPKNFEDLQNITDYYLEILIKIGSKLIISYPNLLNEFTFSKLITNFENIILKNKIIIKNKISYFLSHDLTPYNMDIFKENLSSLFLIIGKAENIDNKTELIKLIIELFIEYISEKNFNFLDTLKLNNSSEKKVLELTRYKFALCFILFDGFMKEQEYIYSIYKDLDEILLKEYDFFQNLCFCLFNNILYIDPFNAYIFLKEKKFYNEKYFNKNKLILFNFKNSTNNNLIFDYIIQYYEHIIENIVIKHFLLKKEYTKYFFNFVLLYSKFQDNFSIVNGIIRPLINYFKLKNENYMNNIDNFLYNNYFNQNTIFKKTDETFIGKISNKENIPEKLKNSLFHKNELKNNNKVCFLLFRIVIICISKYYKEFSKLEINNNYLIDFLDNENIKSSYINNFSDIIEFNQNFFSYYIYNILLFYSYYLSEIIIHIMKQEYLSYLPYKEYLYNIHFILDILNIRCSVIDKDNIINENEPIIISKVLQNILKYVTYFLSHIVQKLNSKSFYKKENYNKNISLHISIFIKILKFDLNIIKEIIPEIKENLILVIKNLNELSNNKDNKIIDKTINKLIEYLYSFGINQEHSSKIDFSMKEYLFNNIMKEENKNYKPITEEKNSCHQNNYIKNTMYYNFFMLIYNKIKNIRNSLKECMEKEIIPNKNFTKIYLVKLTYSLNMFYNFFVENELYMCYDINCILFLKINSFLCKTLKKLLTEKNIDYIYNLSIEENHDIVNQFFLQLFKVIFIIIYDKKHSQLDYYKNYLFEIAKNRKGFHFEQIKNNIIKLFKNNNNYNNIIELLKNKLSYLFELMCKEEDTIDEHEVNDNSIEIESRTICSICQMDSPELDAHLKDCNHEYHMDCIKMLIKSNSSCSKKCPICKRIITGIKEDPNFKIKSGNNQINLNNIFEINNNILENRERNRNIQNNRNFRNNYWRNNNHNYNNRNYHHRNFFG